MTVDLRLGPIAPIRLNVTTEPIALRPAPQPIQLEVPVAPLVLRPNIEPIELRVTGVGVQGPPGAGGSETAEAGETISALKPVVIINGIAYVASSATAAHKGFVAGVAITAATIGNSVQVQTAGELSDESWSWDTNSPFVFVGAGALTQTPPATGWIQPIARVETATKIWIDLKDTYRRAS